MVNRHTELVAELCEWFARELKELEERSGDDLCELLLCAADLGVSSTSVGRAVGKVVAEDTPPDPSRPPLAAQVYRQIIYARLDVAPDQRRAFAEYWINEGRYRSSDVFTMSLLVNVGIYNQSRLTPETLAFVRGWYSRHREFRSDKLAAWAPHFLELAGSTQEASVQAGEVMRRRDKKGSWGQDVRRTLVCAYALASSRAVRPEDLSDTIDFVADRLRQGVISDLSGKAQTLKLFHRVGLVPHDAVMRIRSAEGTRVFISYSRRNLDFAARLGQLLGNSGFDAWLDLTDITLGDEWATRVAESIAGSDVVLMLVSSDSVSSSYFLKEVIFAINKRKPILAVHLDDAVLPDRVQLMLGDVQWVRLGDFPAFERFAATVVEGLKKQASGS